VSGRLTIAVVQGGPSSEAEVSRASAAGVAHALEAAGHRAVRLELDAYLGETLRTGGYDVVFPVVHGAVGEDGSLQGMFEVHEFAYVGSGVLASALAMNKDHARRVFAAAGLPVARGSALVHTEDARPDELAARARREIGARLVVKPASSGSAIGVARFDASAADADVAAAIRSVWTLDDVAIVEHFAQGDEVTCAVFDPGGDGHGTHARAFPVTRIQSPKDAFYTYEARYAPGRSVHQCPAPYDDALTRTIQSAATRAHSALGCRDLSRVDFIVGDAGDPRALTLLEVNTIPGFTATSLYPEALAAGGVGFPELVDQLARAAHRRGPPRRNAPRRMPG
jgi:D-alanine-D-alanine ligase